MKTIEINTTSTIDEVIKLKESVSDDLKGKTFVEMREYFDRNIKEICDFYDFQMLERPDGSFRLKKL